MNWLVENWYIIVAAIAVIAAIIFAAVRFLSLPTVAQVTRIKAWLLWAVTQAEAELGGGTGRLKLSMVYDMFLSAFGWIAKILPFATFSALVDMALEEMRALLKDNAKAAAIVGGTIGTEGDA